jgi:hypothetical protein
MDACALSGARDIVWTVSWGQNFVDDMDDTVARVDISRCDTVASLTITLSINCEREWLSVHGGCLSCIRSLQRLELPR